MENIMNDITPQEQKLMTPSQQKAWEDIKSHIETPYGPRAKKNIFQKVFLSKEYILSASFLNFILLMFAVSLGNLMLMALSFGVTILTMALSHFFPSFHKPSPSKLRVIQEKMMDIVKEDPLMSSLFAQRLDDIEKNTLSSEWYDRLFLLSKKFASLKKEESAKSIVDMKELIEFNQNFRNFILKDCAEDLLKTVEQSSVAAEQPLESHPQSLDQEENEITRENPQKSSSWKI